MAEETSKVTETADERIARLRLEADDAFAKAQAEFDAIAFDKENPHFKSKYASLKAHLKATVPHLNKVGISLRSSTRINGDDMVLRVKLCFKGIVFDESEWHIGKKSLPPQQAGSANTYAMRYTIADLLGICGEDDDDGERATNGQPAKPQSTTTAAEIGF